MPSLHIYLSYRSGAHIYIVILVITIVEKHTFTIDIKNDVFTGISKAKIEAVRSSLANRPSIPQRHSC